MLETRLIEDGEKENIDKLYTANKIIREISFNLLFIENKIIKAGFYNQPFYYNILIKLYLSYIILNS